MVHDPSVSCRVGVGAGIGAGISQTLIKIMMWCMTLCVFCRVRVRAGITMWCVTVFCRMSSVGLELGLRLRSGA